MQKLLWLKNTFHKISQVGVVQKKETHSQMSGNTILNKVNRLKKKTSGSASQSL